MRRLKMLDGARGRVLTIHKVRLWGEPKLSKPKELRGLKMETSIKVGKSTHQVFVKNNDVWVKHRDFFSTNYYHTKHNGQALNSVLDEVIGRERTKKFIYEDAWGSVVLRNEAWLVFPGMIKKYDLHFVKNACLDMQDMFGIPWQDIFTSDIGRFLDSLLSYIAHDYSGKGFVGDPNREWFKNI